MTTGYKPVGFGCFVSFGLEVLRSRLSNLKIVAIVVGIRSVVVADALYNIFAGNIAARSHKRPLL
jgi:hypothetical protein